MLLGTNATFPQLGRYAAAPRAALVRRTPLAARAAVGRVVLQRHAPAVATHLVEVGADVLAEALAAGLVRSRAADLRAVAAEPLDAGAHEQPAAERDLTRGAADDCRSRHLPLERAADVPGRGGYAADLPRQLAGALVRPGTARPRAAGRIAGGARRGVVRAAEAEIRVAAVLGPLVAAPPPALLCSTAGAETARGILAAPVRLTTGEPATRPAARAFREADRLIAAGPRRTNALESLGAAHFPAHDLVGRTRGDADPSEAHFGLAAAELGRPVAEVPAVLADELLVTEATARRQHLTYHGQHEPANPSEV